MESEYETVQTCDRRTVYLIVVKIQQKLVISYTACYQKLHHGLNLTLSLGQYLD